MSQTYYTNWKTYTQYQRNTKIIRKSTNYNEI